MAFTEYRLIKLHDQSSGKSDKIKNRKDSQDIGDILSNVTEPSLKE